MSGSRTQEAAKLVVVRLVLQGGVLLAEDDAHAFHKPLQKLASVALGIENGPTYL